LRASRSLAGFLLSSFKVPFTVADWSVSDAAGWEDNATSATATVAMRRDGRAWVTGFPGSLPEAAPAPQPAVSAGRCYFWDSGCYLDVGGGGHGPTQLQ
jgi:hypothetical protein